MLKLPLAVFAVLGSLTVAHAATVTFTIGNKVKTFTITAQNAARIMTWATAAYPTIPNPAFDPACNPVPGPCAPATIANPEPVLSAIDGLWAGIIANVRSYELEQSKAGVVQPGPVN